MIYDYVRSVDSETVDDPDPTIGTPSNLSIPAVWPQTSERPSVLYFVLVGEAGAGTLPDSVRLLPWPDRSASA